MKIRTHNIEFQLPVFQIHNFERTNHKRQFKLAVVQSTVAHALIWCGLIDWRILPNYTGRIIVQLSLSYVSALIELIGNNGSLYHTHIWYATSQFTKSSFNLRRQKLVYTIYHLNIWQMNRLFSKIQCVVWNNW